MKRDLLSVNVTRELGVLMFRRWGNGSQLCLLIMNTKEL